MTTSCYKRMTGAIVIALLLVTPTSFAELLVTKRVFELDSLTTFSGETLRKVKVGWESYGELNQDKSNVILITHYFSGTSHAAGKYAKEDPQAGYWDAIIGPGKAVDTDKYFVISVDTLVNANVFDPNVITTGPATINPDTGKPYGLDFPVVTIRDFVNVQKALLSELGIDKLHAVIGPSMGSLQAIEWASAYPEWVERMISVIGMAQADAWAVAGLEQWAYPIKSDPQWKDGSYALDEQPISGMTQALAIITQQALHPRSFNQANAGHNALENAPLDSIRANFSVVDHLLASAKARSRYMDANHLLYLIRACQLFVAGHGSSLNEGLSRIKAKSLFLPASGDLLLMPYMAKHAHDSLKALGKPSEFDTIEGNFGHLDGLYSVSQQQARIKAFLDSD